MPWLRPQEIPDGRVPYLVCLPDTAEWRTQFWGAISHLTDVWKWEGDSPLEDYEIGGVWAEVLTSFRRAAMFTAGFIAMYPAASLPDGWLACDGAAYDPDDYPYLFDVIGYSFGGSGSRFNVPNMEDRFPVGAGNNYSPGDTGGADNVTLTIADIPSHNHTYGAFTVGVAVSPGELAVCVPYPFPSNTGSAGGGGSHENRPPYMAMTYAICTGQC